MESWPQWERNQQIADTDSQTDEPPARPVPRAADDYSYIAKRATEIEGARHATPETVCETCEGGGWVHVYSPSPPAFEECPDCHNPDDYPCP